MREQVASRGSTLIAGGRLVAAALALCFALELSCAQARAEATITVGAGCTLSNAITAAETGAPSGGCPAGEKGGPNTIVLPAGELVEHDLHIASGQIVIVGAGAGATIINAAELGRGFLIDAAATVTLEKLSIENGLTSNGGPGSTGSPIGGNGGEGAPGGAIFNAGHLAIREVSLTGNRTGNGGVGGEGTGADSIGGNGGNGGNGGALANTGTATITASTISGNITGNGVIGGGAVAIGGDGGEGGDGGAVYSSGTLALTDSTIEGNLTGGGGPGGASAGIPGFPGSGGAGGGSFSAFGSSTNAVSDVVMANITGNGGAGGSIGGEGGRGGGLVLEFGASASIAASTVATNRTGDGGTATVFAGDGGEGGGIESAAALTITDSTIAGNATGSGGNGGPGGGLETAAPSAVAVTVTDSTLTGNTSASGEGDAIDLIDGDLSLIAATVAANTKAGGVAAGSGIDVIGLTTKPSVLSEHDSLIAANGATNCELDTNSSVASLGHNLSFPDASCAHEVTGDPRLGPLAANGGPTETLALGAGSAAIDEVPSSDSACAGTTDQRGTPRPSGPACDIGAFELVQPVVPVPSPAPAPAPPSSAFQIVSAKLDSHNRLVLVLKDTDAGQFRVAATYKLTTLRLRAHHRPKRITRVLSFARGTVTSHAAGELTLTLKATASALRTLHALRSLHVALSVTFTPTGGHAAHATKALLVHYHKPAKRRRRK